MSRFTSLPKHSSNICTLRVCNYVVKTTLVKLHSTSERHYHFTVNNIPQYLQPGRLGQTLTQRGRRRVVKVVPVETVNIKQSDNLHVDVPTSHVSMSTCGHCYCCHYSGVLFSESRNCKYTLLYSPLEVERVSCKLYYNYVLINIKLVHASTRVQQHTN